MSHGGSMSEALRLAEGLERSLGYDLDQAAAELRRLHAENERLREALRWRPIETAPRDGRRVLVWIDEKHHTGAAFAKLWFYSTDGRLGGGAEGFNGDWNITHWMHIPDAP